MKKVSMLLLSFTLLFTALSLTTGSKVSAKAPYTYVNGKKFYFVEPNIKPKKVLKAEVPWGTGAASAKQVIKFLKSKGFHVVSQKGSHVKLKNSKGKTTIVPSHGNKSLAKGTLNSILKQAGIK
ncbi:type II toxin-antitoxin system HicA family toxin [Bacillus inaquosorum]|uniref:type II toxin-antitoxin system HicA family toxin n=1 Tax=Bacillus inaquosorum TaxID=483913 RepID=UPI00227F4672|nr:type II toxin-antitoxin system HicA family toxin [Bacillus inaquosorum]MCY9030704.1 type II toxin-antitoxin system HicA family toxin [Bacillus inaquosorum]